MNRGLLFETSSRKIKTHVVEKSHCLFYHAYQLQKNDTINHMIIFNDSVSKFYQWSIRGFCRGISVFLVSALAKKKNAEAVEFLEILKKIYLQNKIYFCLKKEKQCFA